ncbi:MAG: insulinase family protein [Aquificota bacterium]|nr:MAG: insulinase family protein [Aquificota bacterium]
MRAGLIIFLLFALSFSFGGAKVKEYVLENGVKLIIKETKGKGIVAGTVFIRSGTHGEEKRGLTNLTALLLTKGTKRYSAYEIASAFEDYGGGIGSLASDDYVEISFSTKTEGLRRGLEVIKSMLIEPLFSEEDLQREKQNQIKAIQSKRERGYELAMEALRSITYKGTNYEVSPLGREEEVASISRQDVIKRWQEILKGKNVVVSLVGDFKEEEVLPYLKEVFSSIPAGEYEIKQKEVGVKENIVQRIKREGTQATVLCAFDGPPFKSEEYFAFKVFDAVLGDGMTSKLFRELREEKGYAYAVYSMYPTRLSNPRLIAYIGTSPEKKEDALRDMVSLVKNASITLEDVEVAKSKIIGSFLLAHQTRARQAWYLGFFEVMGFGWKMDEEYPERIKKVSYEDVLKVKERYVNFHHCVVVEP